MEEIVPVKLIILGQENSGKSCILNRYLTGTFQESLKSTLGAVMVTKVTKYQNQPIKLNIWDTAGQERYRSFSKIYFREARVLILVYDISEPNSIDSMIRWHLACIDEIPGDCLVFVAGAKLDIGTFTEEIKEKIDLFCNQHNCEHHLVSAKTGEGIEKLFDCILKYISRGKSIAKDSVKLSCVSVQKKKECCKG